MEATTQTEEEERVEEIHMSGVSAACLFRKMRLQREGRFGLPPSLSQRANYGERDGGGAEEEAADVGQGLALHHNVVLVLHHLGNSSFTAQFTQVLCIRASIQNAFCGPHKVMRSPKLCDVADVTKVAACGPGRSGWVGEIGGSTYAIP